MQIEHNTMNSLCGFLIFFFTEILTCPKRIKLIMQVLKITTAKTEAVAMAKLQVWWHFVWLLGQKASTYFEQVSLNMVKTHRYCLLF